MRTVAAVVLLASLVAPAYAGDEQFEALCAKSFEFIGIGQRLNRSTSADQCLVQTEAEMKKLEQDPDLSTFIQQHGGDRKGFIFALIGGATLNQCVRPVSDLSYERYKKHCEGNRILFMGLPASPKMEGGG
ncbi:hypothetical protein [Montanilutibacter psychrotolerans]|uniref:DUF1311 domain-containing protein n=1 Tax=Montanilutibacter psychrotolerans TaxID=1327343 RepID=A0A3M8T1V1_9GAMM|nr:hypothetical protein [Lysobacter psychrotolerans]RNF85090.1 hypothetical protein EER27_04715 [Lysobacter psychrotolerans]